MKKAIILVLALVLTLSACMDKANIESGGDAKNKQFQIKENILEDECPSYKRAAVDLPSDKSFVRLAVKTENIMYYCAANELGANLFYKYDISENLCTQLDIEISGNVHSIDAADNYLYILVNQLDDKGNRSYEFKQFDTVTQNTRSILLDKATGEKEGIEIAGFSALGDRIYVNAFDSIYCFDDAGKLQAEIKTENVCKGMFNSIYDDSLKMYNYVNNSVVIQEVNPELQLNCKYVLSTRYNEVFQGLSHNQIFVTDENNIYSLDLETGNKRPYVNIPLYNLRTSNFIPLSNESFFTIQSGVPTFWIAGTEEDTEQITILKCATYNASYELQVAVSLFNYNHEDIKIEIADYAVYNDGLTKLMVEITAGKIPDIFDLTGVPKSTLNSSVLLENLEGRLPKSTIVPNILELLKEDDGIFEIVPGFKIAAMAGSSKYITAPTMDVDILIDLAEKAHSEGKNLFPKYITREKFISCILSFSGDSFVNVEKGYCNFEDEKFASLMQFALELPSDEELDEKTYGEEVGGEWSSILDGKQLISIVETGDPVSELLSLRGLYGGEVKFVGFPTNSGNGIAMTPFVRIGMSSTSNHKDEIWAFFDYLLSKAFQAEMSTTGYMPVVSEYLDEYIDKIVTEYKAQPLRLGLSPSVTIDCPLVDDETENDAWEIIGRVDCINEYDTNIYKIVLEECQAFFAGQKDISTVMSIIQNRASIYVSEKQ